MSRQSEFMDLYTSSHDQFVRFCHAMTGEESTAQDLVNDTLLKAFEHFDRLQKPESFTAYLIGIARRVYLNQLRRKRILNTFALNHIPQVEDKQDRTSLSIEVKILYEALSKLPPRQREAIVLFEITGFSLKEICVLQKSNLSAVKARLSRGREKLRKLLTDKETEVVKKEKNYGKEFITC